MKRKYSEKIHAERLLKVLEKKYTCDKCPASRYHNSAKSPVEVWDDDKGLGKHPCMICNDFVGIGIGEKRERVKKCPCFYFETESEAFKVSWLALEEKGYLE